MNLAAVILAAGKGTRMNSGLPKVLHPLCGDAMLSWVVDAVQEAGVQKLVVVAGFGAEQVSSVVADQAQIALQTEQLGTAHALAQAGPQLKDFTGCILVLCGDTPLIRAETLAELIERHHVLNSAATVLTTELEDPTGYGRLIRNEQGQPLKIVEQKDATVEESLVHEVNTGIYCFEAAGLFAALEQVSSTNAQGEYYLTDIIDVYAQSGLPVNAVLLKDPLEVSGINDRVQLAEAEKHLRRRLLEEMMRSGVTIIDPASTFVSRQARAGRDTVLYPGTILEGETIIGRDCVIGPASRLSHTAVGNRVTLQNSVAVESVIGDDCLIGPFAYLRPGTELGQGVKVGDFVEIKKSIVGNGSKVPHLSYIGDAVLGEKVNIGAGTITCNYDGSKKWTTQVGDAAFIGSNTNLVAPVSVGERAITGAGSTITKDVPAGSLGIERAKQKVLKEWADKKKAKD